MKKVKLLKDVELEGESFKVKTILGLDDNTANTLINEGKAEEVKTLDPTNTDDPAQAEGIVKMAIDSALAEFRKTQEELIKRLPRVEVIEREDPSGGFKSFGHFLSCVKTAAVTGQRPEALQKYLDVIEKKNKALRDAGIGKAEGDVMLVGDDAQGGFLAPGEHRAELLTTALEQAFFYPRARFIPMAMSKIDFPAIFDDDHTEGKFYGGVEIVRVAEAAQKTESKPKVGQIELNLHEVAGLCYVSNNLLEDSMVSVEAMLMSVFGQSIAFVIDDDCINGDGAGKPQGFLNSPALVTVTPAGAGIAADDVLNIWQSVFPASKGRAIWIANHELFTALAKTYIGQAPMWMPANGLSGKPYDMLMGKPIFFTEKAPAPGQKGSLSAVDPGMYLIGGKAGLNVKTDMSIHIRFDKDQTAFRYVIRYDGKGWWKNSLKPKNGSPDFRLSPFVTLDEEQQ